MSIPDFFRAHAMTMAYESQIERLDSITDINQTTDDINKKLEQLVVKLTALIKPNTQSLTYSGSESFKEVFAHSHCYVMCEAMHEELSNHYEVNCVLLIDDNNEVVHYLTKVTINNQPLYIDAYGVFSELEQVKARYANTTISNIEYLDPCDDKAPRYQKLKDLMIDTYDAMGHYSEDIDIEIKYGEYFNKLIVADVLNNIVTHNITH
jgi:hypothetical protein